MTRIAESWCKHWCKPFGWGTAIPAGGYFLFLGSIFGWGDEASLGFAYALRAAAIQEITVALNPEPKPMPRGTQRSVSGMTPSGSQ